MLHVKGVAPVRFLEVTENVLVAKVMAKSEVILVLPAIVVAEQESVQVAAVVG